MKVQDAINGLEEGSVDILDGDEYEVVSRGSAPLVVARRTEVVHLRANSSFLPSELEELRDLLTAIIQDGRVK